MRDTRDYEPKCGDAARRCAAEVTLHAIAGAAGKWAAIRLQDGQGDRTAYDTRGDAVRHQLSPEHCMFFLIPPDGMTTGQADRVLDFWRQSHDKGLRTIDPVDHFPSMPLTPGAGRRQIRLLTRR